MGNYKKDCSMILNHYGVEQQKLKLVEECSELIQAIMKHNEMNIAEEIADVEVIIDQLLLNDEELSEIVIATKQQKVERQLKRIENGKIQ